MATRKQVRGRVRFILFLGAILATALFVAVAYADTTIPDGDGVTPVAANPLAFGNVYSGVASTDTALVAISRQGNAGSPNVFKDGSTVTITVLSVSGTGLSAVIDAPNTITLPGNWGALANTTRSGTVTSTVTINSSVLGAGSGVVTYRAEGQNSDGDTIRRDAAMNVTWTTLPPPDTTAPVTTITPTPGSPNGNNGWYISAVNAQVAASDSGGGTVSETRSVLDPATIPTSFDDLPSANPYAGSGASVSADGVHTIFAASRDSYGNKESVKSWTFKIDTTHPSVSCGTADGAWHATDVSIACTATDAGSGLANAGDASFNLTTSVANGTETDNASTNSRDVADAVGNLATAGPVSGNMVDKKAPVITPDAAPTFLLGQSPAVVWGTATDGGSGPASQRVSASADTSSVGAKHVDLTASDVLGNSTTVSAPYSVIYSWHGFFKPVDNLPFVNVAKAGSAIPVKFSLSGFQGYSIFKSGYPISVKINLATFLLEDQIEETVTAGGSSLNYDSSTDQYIYVWKTDKAWAGTGRQLQVQLIDGTTYVANFKLMK